MTVTNQANESTALSLVKYLVASGMGSRRECAAAIMAGRVKVNGDKASDLTQIIAPAHRVSVDDRIIAPRSSAPVYLLLNKPEGYLTTTRDERDRDSVMDLVPAALQVPGLVPVGRLDMETSGLLMLTNDGELAYRLTHPSFGVEKEYVVVVRSPLSSMERRQLLMGVELPDGFARAKAVRPLTLRRPEQTGRRPPGRTRYSITMLEGRKREVRLMFQAVGSRVESLKRIRVGTLRLESLDEGQVRALTPIEVQRLKELVAKDPPLPLIPARSRPSTSSRPPSGPPRRDAGPDRSRPSPSSRPPSGPPRRDAGPDRSRPSPSSRPPSGPPRRDAGPDRSRPSPSSRPPSGPPRRPSR